MQQSPEPSWRVVYHGKLTPELINRLNAAGITTHGRPRDTGEVDAAGRQILAHPLRVRATDAEQAYRRACDALGEHDVHVEDEPSLMIR
jgi:hypothetical protein